MITKNKILVYKKYDGDLDAWARIGTSEEKNIMSDDDWYLIDSLIQEIIISKFNLIQRLKVNTDSEDVRNEIIEIANKVPQ